MPALFEQFWDSIKDKRVFDLCLLGSHDSSAFSFERGYNQIFSDNDTLRSFASMPSTARRWLGIQGILEGFARTQTLNITEQLNCGVRSFDLRVALVDGILVLNHSIVTDEVSDVLPQFAKWLEEHPKEIIELQLKWTDTDPNANLQDAVMKTLRESALGHLIVPKNDVDKSVQELVEMNKRVILFVEGPPIDDALDLYTFKNVYRGFNRAEEKIADLKAQLDAYNSDPGTLFRIEWTLTPNSDDVKNAILRGDAGSALRSLAATMPDVIETLHCVLSKAHVVAFDFITPDVRMAERLILK